MTPDSRTLRGTVLAQKGLRRVWKASLPMTATSSDRRARANSSASAAQTHSSPGTWPSSPSARVDDRSGRWVDTTAPATSPPHSPSCASPQDRFFELDGGTLHYYSRRAFRGSVTLAGCVVKESSADATIQVSKPNRKSPVLQLRAGTASEQQNWLAALRSAAEAPSSGGAPRRTKASRNKGTPPFSPPPTPPAITETDSDRAFRADQRTAKSSSPRAWMWRRRCGRCPVFQRAKPLANGSRLPSPCVRCPRGGPTPLEGD